MAQPDLFVLKSSGDGNNFVFVNDGRGVFTDTQQTLGSNLSFAAAYGDLDGDGDIDVVDGTDPSARIYLNDGSGNLAQSQIVGQDLPITRSVALADLDGDTDLDLVLGIANSQFTSNNQVFLNDGTGQFTFKEHVGSNNCRSLAVADLNGDTFPDIFETVQNDADRVWINDGMGSFSDSGQNLSVGPGFAVALGDLDNDNDLDAFIAQDGMPNQIWLNDGDGNFSLSAQIFPSANSLSCGIADLDNDGDLDLVVGNDGAINFETLETWVNDGTGNFTRSAVTSPAFRTVAISFGDIEGDGDLDIYLANIGGDRIFINSGSGAFAESTQTLPNTITNGAAFVYLKLQYDDAVAAWNESYTIIGLLRMQDQLTAKLDHRRAR